MKLKMMLMKMTAKIVKAPLTLQKSAADVQMIQYQDQKTASIMELI
jgi:hypothetical protein